MELVSTGCQRGHSKIMKMDRNAADSLNCVSVDANTPRTTERGQFCNRLDGAGFIVRQHECYKASVITKGVGHVVRVGKPVLPHRNAIHRKSGGFKPRDRFTNGG